MSKKSSLDNVIKGNTLIKLAEMAGILPNTQIEQIIWHKYPDEKPTVKELYLIQYREKYYCDKDLIVIDFAIFETDVSRFYIEGTMVIDVIVWAKNPVGWKG